MLNVLRSKFICAQLQRIHRNRYGRMFMSTMAGGFSVECIAIADGVNFYTADDA